VQPGNLNRAIDSFIERCVSAPSFARQARVLRSVVASPQVHALFLNTLARLEYVGVRKMLKSRRAEALDAEGLQHILEEAVHTTRLKKIARSVAPEPAAVETFSDAHTLAGDAAERYFQDVDAAAHQCVGTERPELCYLLTSTAIEVRAKVFYPAYQSQLTQSGLGVSLRSIIADEESHLDQMVKQLFEQDPNAHSSLSQVLAVEEAKFIEFMAAVEARLSDINPALPR
jgi:hypothetical protein